MAVAHVTTAFTNTPGGGSPLTRTITVSGTNPVLVVHVSANSPAAGFQVATAVDWSLGGSATKMAEKRNTVDGQNAFSQTWVLAAPAAGAGTVSVTFDNSNAARNCTITAQVFSGADQTTPTPVGDVIQVDTASDPLTVTPSNLASGDATAACMSNESGNTPTSAGPNQRVLDTNDPFTLVGDATNTTGVTFTGDGSSLWKNNLAATAVRIVAAAAAGPTTAQIMPAIAEFMNSGGMVGRDYV